MGLLNNLNQEILSCCKCSRLVKFRNSHPKKPLYQNEKYLRQPTPGFGDPKANILVLGLAPSAHGGNRTGRIFTGDESAKFLMKMLYQTGFANQPSSTSLKDELKLTKCYITAAVKCVPPQNKPLTTERNTCLSYLEQELAFLPYVKVILALGKIAYQAAFQLLRKNNFNLKMPAFRHGQIIRIDKYNIFTSYHPSPQNTYTGRLTEQMFFSLLSKVKNYIDF